MRRSKKMIVAAVTAALMTTGGIATALDLGAKAGSDATVAISLGGPDASDADLGDILSGVYYGLGGIHELTGEIVEHALEKVFMIKHGVRYLPLALEHVGHKVYFVLGGVKWVVDESMEHVLGKAAWVVGNVKYFAFEGVERVGRNVYLTLGGVKWLASAAVEEALETVGDVVEIVDGISVFADLDVAVLAQILG